MIAIAEKYLSDLTLLTLILIALIYYQDKVQTPIFEQTVHLNSQGIASFFRYDYPDYSLELNLKKVRLTPLDCKNR